jgi:hypothetical protein
MKALWTLGILAVVARTAATQVVLPTLPKTPLATVVTTDSLRTRISNIEIWRLNAVAILDSLRARITALETWRASLSATPTPTAVAPVTDLTVASVTANTATLGFTAVNDGTGQPAAYYLRYAAGTITWATATELPPFGSGAIGTLVTTTVPGLTAGTAYQFQVVAYRGTPNVNAVFGALSNVASGTTAAAPVPTPTPAPTPSPSGVVFQSDWPVAGTASSAVSDGGKWDSYWEFNNGTTVQLLSVVSGVGTPGGRNALKVVQRGSTYAAAVQKNALVPVSTDYYVRFYIRNDDTSGAGDHTAVTDIYSYANLIYVRKYSGATNWVFDIGMYGCGYTYPIDYWRPAPLAHGVWYRLEYHVHFVDPTHIQLQPRLYDAVGSLLADGTAFYQSDVGTAVWNGRSNWTLADYYAAGYTHCVVPTSLQSFSVGNNGQASATDTGLSWYFAGVVIRTDTWGGP